MKALGSSERVAFAPDVDDILALRFIAQRDRRTLSWCIREAIAMYLRAHGVREPSNPTQNETPRIG